MEMNRSSLLLIFALLLEFLLAGCNSLNTMQYYRETIPWEPNFDEQKMPPVVLPDALKCLDGRRVRTAEDWQQHRRPELLRLFEETMYGKRPPMPDHVEYTLLSEKNDIFDGQAIRREFLVEFRMDDGRCHDMVVLLYIPTRAPRPVPLFAGLVFQGNHALTDDPSVRVTGQRYPNTPEKRAEWGQRRGHWKDSFPIQTIIERGYACAFASYHDIFPDRIDGWTESIYRLWFDETALSARIPGYSSIGAWAWGISRVIDCAVTQPEVDGTRIACVGHSRLGKTTLWAGVCDERIALACVNDSGCGGAALSRRLIGETLFSMFHKNHFGEFWFTDTLAERSLHPEDLPVDQHELVALMAPRAVSIHSATEDTWADPKGEYLSAHYAGPAYRLFGIDGLTSPEPPPPDTPVGETVSYLFRTGRHALQLADWEHYLSVADALFGTQKTE